MNFKWSNPHYRFGNMTELTPVPPYSAYWLGWGPLLATDPASQGLEDLNILR